MRIATSQLFSSTMQTMEDQQSQLLELQQQVSSGVALQTAGDNPVAAAQAVQLSSTSATLAQYATNQNLALSSLGQEDSTLGNVLSTLTSINTSLVHAGDASLSDANRAAIAQELEGERNQLLSLANARNGDGSYVFGGFQGSAQPFTTDSSGAVTYAGDNGVQLVQVSDNRQIQTNDPGSAVFLTAPAVGSSPVSAGSAGNTGTGIITAATVNDPSAASNDTPYGIVFSTATGSLTYSVMDNSTTPPTALASDQTYTAGQPIQLGTGMSLSISGTPADGDSFTVTQPNTQGNADIFAAIDNAIAALNQPVANNATGAAALQNSMPTAMTQLQNTIDNVTTVQAGVGGREQELQALQTVTTTNSTQVQSNLADLTGTDMVAALSQFVQLQNALSASQQSFSQVQGMSLFKYLNS